MHTSNRERRLPGYVVSELAAAKKKLVADGADLIDVSAGDMDLHPPELAVEALREALADSRMSRYSFQTGLTEFREAVANYMERRFGVSVDPMAEILPLIGSKDGLSHLPLALVDPGDVCIVPEPGYPAYAGGAILADAQVETVALTSDNRFLLELSELPRDRLAKARLVFLNYPNNPTGAVAPRDYLERTVEACSVNGIALAYDNPYCELTYDGYVAPSVLEIPGARDVALEFHSLSKSACMTGWRIGWAVGSAKLIAALSKIKSYVDAGPFLAIQQAGVAVLGNLESIVEPVRARLRESRDAAVAAVGQVGFKVKSPKAAMYLWFKLPGEISSSLFAQDVLHQEALMVMPGSAFGEGGEGYVRVAFTIGAGRWDEVAGRIVRALARLGTVNAPA